MTNATESRAANFDRRWALGFVLMLGSVAVWRWMASGAPTGGDGSQYLAHALALLEGRPYDDIGYLHTPSVWDVGPLRYPPGLPVTLVPLLAAFGSISQAPFILMHLFLLAFAVLAGAYFAREGGRAIGWGVGGMVAAAMLLEDHANVVRSDLGFCAFVWGALLLADRPGRWSWKRSGLITLLGCGALAYRLAAAPLVPAVAALAVIRRKHVGGGALLIAVIWLGVLLLILQYFGLGEGPSDSTGGSGGAVRSLMPSIERWVQAASHRFPVYIDALSRAYLYPLPWKTPNQVYHVLALGLTVVGLWPWIRRRVTTLALFFAATTMVMLAVSPVWQSRYLWVLTPFLCYGLLQGIVTVLAWAEARLLKRQASAHPGLPLKISLSLVLLAVGTAVIQPRPSYAPELETWRGVGAVLTELDTGAPLRVASNRPRKVAWFTGVPSMPIVWRDLDLFLREAEQRDVTIVVFTTAVSERDQLDGWEDWLATYPDLFVPIAEVGPVRVFELTRYTP